MELGYTKGFQEYRKKDVIIAVCAVLFFIVGMETDSAIMSALQIDWGTASTFVWHFRWPIAKTAMTVLPVVIVISIMKQGSASIGIHKENLWNAVRLGVMLSLIPIFWGVLPIVLYSENYWFILYHTHDDTLIASLNGRQFRINRSDADVLARMYELLNGRKPGMWNDLASKENYQFNFWNC